MQPFRLQEAVVDRLQSLLSQAQPIVQQLSSMQAQCLSLRDDVASAQKITLQNAAVHGCDGESTVTVAAGRREFLLQLSAAVAALQDSQLICEEFKSATAASSADNFISLAVRAVRINSAALSHLNALSSGPYSDSAVACIARGHHRTQQHTVCARVEESIGFCIKVCAGSDVFLSSDCRLLLDLQNTLQEHAPDYAEILIREIADVLAAVVTDGVFNASHCISHECSSGGISVRCVVQEKDASAPAAHRSLSSFIGSLDSIAAAVRLSFPCAHAEQELCFSNRIVVAVTQRAVRSLCSFAAHRAADISQAQEWSDALQQLPPHIASCSPASATFWGLWASRISVDVVSSTQQLLQIGAAGCLPHQCSALQCETNAVFLYCSPPHVVAQVFFSAACRR
jgi:hypothetical protein